MNIACLVEVTSSYEPFYELLDYFFAFYTNSAKRDTSVLVLSGKSDLEKLTLVRLFRITRLMGDTHKNETQSEVGVITDFIDTLWLKKYPNGTTLKNETFTRDITTCIKFSRSSDANDIAFDNIKMLHKAVNEGIVYNTRSDITKTIEKYKIINPSVLILGASAKPYFSGTDIEDNLPRKAKYLHLPNKSEIFLDSSLNCFVGLLGDITNIVSVATVYDRWLKYNLFWLGIDVTIIGDNKDIFLMFLDWIKIIIPKLTISRDWWKIIFKHKAFGKGFYEGLKIYEEKSVLVLQKF